MHRHRDEELDRDHAANPYDQLLRAGICRTCGTATVVPCDTIYATNSLGGMDVCARPWGHALGHDWHPVAVR